MNEYRRGNEERYANSPTANDSDEFLALHAAAQKTEYQETKEREKNDERCEREH